MDLLADKFSQLGVDNAPGQEVLQKTAELKLLGDPVPGKAVDFSHGDVDAFEPVPGTLEEFIRGVKLGGEQAYTEYRGRRIIREDLAEKISAFTKTEISPESQIIITPGTQGALFLAMGSMISPGDKVAIVEPDYFANRKIAQFFDAEIFPVSLDYFCSENGAGVDLAALESAFKAGVKVFLFSNPNNPTGIVYSQHEIRAIASLARKYGISVIADQLYSRQIFDRREYTHLCAVDNPPENLVTIIGPSKTESLSGYRLGIAFGSAKMIARMEKLQAIVSLRAAGYSQAVLKLWFDEPKGWMEERIAAHQRIRDDLLLILNGVDGVKTRATEAGSYLFPQIPALIVTIEEFARILRCHANVTVTPGTEFGPQFTRSFRINFSQNHQAAVAAIRRTMEMVNRYRA